MGKYREQVEELLEIVGNIEDAEAEAWVDANLKKHNRLLIRVYSLEIASLALLFIAKLVGNHMDLYVYGFAFFLIGIVLFVFALICYNKYFKFRKAFILGLTKDVYEECYPEKGLARCYYYLKKFRRKLCLIEGVYVGMGTSLFYQGKYNDVVQVIKLLDCNCNSLLSINGREILRMMVAGSYEKQEVLDDCFSTMKKIAAKSKRKNLNDKLFELIRVNEENALLQKQGKLKELYDKELAGFKKDSSILTKVAYAHYLYQLAKELRYDDNMEEYKSFVLENGGTTWFKRSFEEGYEIEELADDYLNHSVDEEKFEEIQSIELRAKLVLLFIGISIGMVLMNCILN